MTSRAGRKWANMVLTAVVAGLLQMTSHAVTVPPDWKTECIGRYQISVPGEVEVALTTMRKLYKPNDTPPPYYVYSDGTTASHTRFNGMQVTVEVPFSEFKAFKKFAISRYEKYREDLIKEANSEDIDSLREKALKQAAHSKPMKFNANNMFGWEFLGGMDLYQFYDGHIFFYENSAQRPLTVEEKNAPTAFPVEFERSIAQADLDSFIRAFHPRKLFEPPKGQGLCIPYAFIADDGKKWREVGVTMRLKDHPDVEIFLLDKSPLPSDPSGPNRNAKEEIAFFWKWMNRSKTKEVRLGFPSFRTVKMDSREGAYSFAEILRPDGNVDFGYVAYVKGDPDAATDTPNLMLYVIRTAANAKGKPVSKGDLKDIAQKIAASVKRHH